MQLSQQEINRYKITVTYSASPSALEINRIFARSAKSVGQLPQTRSIKQGGWGIGDLVVPAAGRFAGMPLVVVGFTCTYFEPLSGLPAGQSDALIVETVDSQGCNTAMRFYLPFNEVN